jgi:hypothetical protein
MSFPLNPSNDEIYINALGTQYKYVSADSKWIIESKEVLGNQGVTGLQGATGDQGTQGTQGVTGLSGVTVDSINGFIEAAKDKTYILDQYAPTAYTINSLVIKTVSGTCTAAIKIDGTSVTSISAVSVTSSESTANATGANAVSAGNTVTLVISSNSAAADLSFTLRITR